MHALKLSFLLNRNPTKFLYFKLLHFNNTGIFLKNNYIHVYLSCIDTYILYMFTEIYVDYLENVVDNRIRNSLVLFSKNFLSEIMSQKPMIRLIKMTHLCSHRGIRPFLIS